MKQIDLSIIIIAGDEAETLSALLARLQPSLEIENISYEIIVVFPDKNDRVKQIFKQYQTQHISSLKSGYGIALSAGIQLALGTYIITMDAGQTPADTFLYDLWNARDTADVILASRYVPGGEAKMPALRLFFSRVLNIIFSRGLDLHVKDMSSGFRLYKSHLVKQLATDSKGYEILQEILVRILMAGYQIREIPFTYKSQNKPKTIAQAVSFGLAYIKTFFKLWQLRNSIASADYDSRAYDAMMPPQRYWQRQRYKHITQMLDGQGKCLDIGCGSSRIIETLPQGSLALDILIRKVRFSKQYGHAVIQGSIFNLPVLKEAFPCVICSQVVEHIPRENVFDELNRVLQPGGFLILGTPDYAKWQWIVIEWLYKILLPQAYADEHITHYTYDELYNEFVTKRGYALEAVHYILQGELILGLRKPFNK